MCSILKQVGRGGFWFHSTRVGQALAESLKTNGNLERLDVKNNKIGNGGAEAPAAECLPAGSAGLSDSLPDLTGDSGQCLDFSPNVRPMLSRSPTQTARPWEKAQHQWKLEGA